MSLGRMTAKKKARHLAIPFKRIVGLYPIKCRRMTVASIGL